MDNIGFLGRLSVGRKIGLGFGFAAAVIILLLGITNWNMRKLSVTAQWKTHTYEVLDTLGDTLSQLKDAETGQRGYLLTGVDSYLEPYNSAMTVIDKDLRKARDLTKDNAQQQHRLDVLEPVIASRLALISESIELRRNNGERAAVAEIVQKHGKKLMDNIRLQINEMMDAESALLRQRTEEADAATRFATITTIGGGVLALLLMFLFSSFISSGIVRSLAALVKSAEAIAQGDLRQGNLTVISEDEIGRLTTVFNKMTDSLRELARQNLVGTENLNTSAAEILASIQQQAASAKEQASAVHETTTTMEEVRQSGLQISERAKRVAADAEATTTITASGLKSVQDAVRTMTAIREQVEQVAGNIVALSEKNQAVGDIVATVTDIAEQANLLALNAAIEAAAAGEHGRSFSVVANELKNLAEQAKQGTVQVRSILGEIQKGINSAVMLTEEAVKRVESGKQQTDVAERTIRQMGETTQQSVSAFQQIVAATSQQHIGFEQVGQALVNIRQASEQTASGTGQLEKATASLNALGQQLRKSVERYKI